MCGTGFGQAAEGTEKKQKQPSNPSGSKSNQTETTTITDDDCAPARGRAYAGRSSSGADALALQASCHGSPQKMRPRGKVYDDDENTNKETYGCGVLSTEYGRVVEKSDEKTHNGRRRGRGALPRSKLAGAGGASGEEHQAARWTTRKMSTRSGSCV